MSLLARYGDGQETQVWLEIVEKDAAARDGELRTEVEAILSLLMDRVQHNLELLAQRLADSPYELKDPQAALCAPDPETESLIGSFEKEVGPLPLAMAAFYRRIGSVDFRGKQASWEPPGAVHEDSSHSGLVQAERCYADPLMVPPLKALYDECLARADELAELGPEEGLLVTFSPDYLAKVEGSGGLYGVLLPDPCADTDLEIDSPTSFVGYLRRAISWAGFPGLAHYQAPPVDDLELLCEELLGF